MIYVKVYPSLELEEQAVAGGKDEGFYLGKASTPKGLIELVNNNVNNPPDWFYTSHVYYVHSVAERLGIEEAMQLLGATRAEDEWPTWISNGERLQLYPDGIGNKMEMKPGLVFAYGNWLNPFTGSFGIVLRDGQAVLFERTVGHNRFVLIKGPVPEGAISFKRGLPPNVAFAINAIGVAEGV